MALSVSYEAGAGGDSIIGIIKYDARAGRIFRIDRENNTNDPVDITNSFKAVFDFENLEQGSIWFRSSGAPLFALSVYGQPLPGAPSNDYKPGIRVIVKLAADAAGGKDAIRELASTAKAFLRGLDALHDAYLAGVAANPGKLPVVKLSGSVPIVTEGKDAQGKPQKTTNYSPTFEIVSWVDRPKDLVPMLKGAPTSAPAVSAPAASAPPATGSTRVGPPAAAPATAPAASDDDFG